jgi:hypothetical protein
MSYARSYVTILFALLLGGGATATAPGCVVQLTDCDECGEASVCHSRRVGDECFCEAGYEWANEGENFDCDRIPSRPDVNACTNPFNVQVGDECRCACGYTWCSADPADLTCCVSDDATCEESSTDPLPATDEGTADESGTTGFGTGTTGFGTGTSTGFATGTGTGTSTGGGGSEGTASTG